VLVSLQPLDEPLPGLLREAIARAPRDWLWLVRAHPHQRPGLARLRQRLSPLGEERVEIEEASRRPLFALLAASDHHVTCWSSVVYEALAFDVPSTVIDPAARALYARELAEGSFRAADDAPALLASIARSEPPARAPRAYIEHDRACAERALRSLLEPARRGPAPPSGPAGSSPESGGQEPRG